MWHLLPGPSAYPVSLALTCLYRDYAAAYHKDEGVSHIAKGRVVITPWDKSKIWKSGNLEPGKGQVWFSVEKSRETFLLQILQQATGSD